VHHESPPSKRQSLFLRAARWSDFTVAIFVPQAAHLPSAAIFGCSLTSAMQSPRFGIESPPHESLISSVMVFLRTKATLLMCNARFLPAISADCFTVYYLQKPFHNLRVLVFLEDVARCFLFSPVPTVSSSSPRLIRVKTEIHTLVF
jgi:hypothetical protein